MPGVAVAQEHRHVELMGKGEDDAACTQRAPVALPATATATTRTRGAWTEELTEAGIWEVVAALGRWPTTSELRAMGHGFLLGQLVRYRAYDEWAHKLGFTPSQRGTPAEWTDERIEAGLRELVEACGGWPRSEHIAQAQATKLYAAASRAGGIARWRRRLGNPPLAKIERPAPGEPGVWTDARIETELAAFLEGRDRFPSQAEFSRAGKDRLRRAINDNGGADHWARRFGLRPPNRGRQPGSQN